MGWTPENIERVRTMAFDGLSATQIAASIGGVSRNAVIGVGTRNKITFHGGHRGGAPKSDTQRLIRVFIPKPVPAAPAPQQPYAGSRMISFDDLKNHECRFAFGASDFRFCALPVMEGRPYCSHHVKLTTQPR
jgi:GcrA cell cycle regulator